MNVMVIQKKSVIFHLLIIFFCIASLIPLYNHEAKISLFIQIAMAKEGSALLLSNGIMNNISGCKFINTRFDRIQSGGNIISSNRSLINS